jgi:hypothetical protein
MDPGFGLDVVAKRKILPCQESNPGSPARSLVTILPELSRLMLLLLLLLLLITINTIWNRDTSSVKWVQTAQTGLYEYDTGRDFSVRQDIQTDSVAYTASCTRRPFPGDKTTMARIWPLSPNPGIKNAWSCACTLSVCIQEMGRVSAWRTLLPFTFKLDIQVLRH